MLALLRERDFGLVWLAGLVSQLGRHAFELALTVHVYQLTNSALAAGAAWGASSLPSVLVGSLAGVFVDRWNRKRVMIASDLLRAALLLPAIFLSSNLLLLYALAAALGTVKLFFTPAENALLPTLVGPERLMTANALNALNNQFGLLAGAAIGGTAYAALGFGGVLLIDAAAFLSSALLVRLVRADGRAQVQVGDGDLAAGVVEGGSAWGRMAHDWRTGLRVVRGDAALRVLFLTCVLVGVAEGVFVTLAISPLVLDVFQASEAQVGWIIAAQGVGGLCAGLVVGSLGHLLTRRGLLVGGMLGMGVCDFAIAHAHRLAGTGTPAVLTAMGVMVVGGVPLVASTTAPQLVMQVQAADAVRGRVFGAYTSVTGIAMLVGFAAGGVLGDAVGIVEVLSAGALLRVLAGVFALLWMPRDARSDSAAANADIAAPSRA